MTTLGLDFATRMATLFGGRLYTGSFTKWTAGAFNPADPAGKTSGSSATYTFDGISFGYREGMVDGEQIKNGDYRVMILLGTIKLNGALVSGIVPNSGDTVLIPPPNQTVPIAGSIVAVGSVTQATVSVQVRGPAL